MYLSFYGLTEKPFSQTPDPKFLYWNDAYRETIASLRYGIQERKGFVTMIGEAGTGKTTLLRKLLDDLGPDVVSVFLFNPNASFEEILEYTLSELGIPASTGRKLAMLQRLNDFLLAAFQEGKNTILLIDEAQDLETEVLESLRLLSNLETAKEKILQIVLSGQPELAARLAQPNLRQLKQRIAVRCRIEPLGRHELAQYIAARLAVAGGRADLFSPETLDPIWDFARGIPRLINTVCDNALLVGYALGRETIDREVIGEVVSDLGRIDVSAFAPITPAQAPAPVSAAPAARPAHAETPATERPPEPASDIAATAALGSTQQRGQEPPIDRTAASSAAPHGEPAWATRAAAQAPTGPRRPLPDEVAAPRPRRSAWLAITTVLVLAVVSAAAWAMLHWQEIEPRLQSLVGETRLAGLGAADTERHRDHKPIAMPPAAPPQPDPVAAAPPPVLRADMPPAANLDGPQAGLAQPAERAAAPPETEPPAIAHDAHEVQPQAASLAEGAPTATQPPAVAAAAEPQPDGVVAVREPQPATVAAQESPPPMPSEAASEPALAVAQTMPSKPVQAAITATPSAAGRKDLQVSKRAGRASKRVVVQRGDTLMNLATREYGYATYTVLDVLRAANPGIQDVNRIIAGSEIVFPDPGPSARIQSNGDGVSVLIATTPVLLQAQEMQRVIASRYRLPADLEPVALGDGRSLYRVSLREVPDKSQAQRIAESLGSILRDPS